MTASAEAEAMYARYQEGATIRQVAAEFGRCHQAVGRLFRRRGWPIRPPQPRLPYAPLERHLPPELADAAERLDIDRCTLARYRHNGYIPADRADRYAIAAGTHPAAVWGAAYYAAFTVNSEAA
jgi:hypothetical protein